MVDLLADVVWVDLDLVQCRRVAVVAEETEEDAKSQWVVERRVP